jgi:hypothetical protein
MVTFYDIRNIDKFLGLINSCTGRVFLTASNGSVIDIKDNFPIQELLIGVCAENGIEKLALTIENQQDMPNILSYLLSCNSTPSLKPLI